MEKIEFEASVDKETKRTFRFSETEDTYHVGYLYVKKLSLKEIGYPKKIKVTIEPLS